MDDLIFELPTSRFFALGWPCCSSIFPSCRTTASRGGSWIRSCCCICSCDDFGEIAARGESHLPFLCRFSDFHFGIPGERRLRDLVNRIDPILFGRCFGSWIAAPEKTNEITAIGNGAKNMAVVRRFSLGLIRAHKDKGSIKAKRKAAGWDPGFLLEILQQK